MIGRWWSALDRGKRVRLALVAGVGVALVAGAAAYLAFLVRSFETPQFKRALLDRASASAGTRIQARDVELRLLQGVVAEGVTVANPPPFTGSLAAADSLVLRYDPWALLRGRLALTRLTMDKPALDLAMDSRGVFAYERLARARGTAPSGALPIALVISKLSIDGGRIVVRDPRSALVTMEGADLDSSVRLASGSLEGDGSMRIATVRLGAAFVVRDVSAPLRASGGVLALTPVRATLADGRVDGEASVHLQKGFRYEARVGLKNAQVRKLLEEAQATPGMSGRLTAEARVEGTGGMETLEGKGQVQVEDCQVTRSPVMTLLATVLRVPELARPDFDECRATFTLGGGRLTNPSLSLKGPAVQLTGRGVTSLRSLAIDYDMTLALGETLVRRIPAEELRAAFEDRGDGFSTIDFKVTGTTSAPKSDLGLRLGKAAAESGIRKFLRRKLF